MSGKARNGVREARVAAGLTQAQVAEKAYVSRQTVNAVESGRYAPSVYVAMRIAAVLGTTVEALFGHAESSGTEPAGEAG